MGRLCHKFRNGRRRWTLIIGFALFGRHQIQKLGTRHSSQHASRHGVGFRIIVDVDVQPIHHIKVRIGEQFLHGNVAHIGAHTPTHERLEIGLWREHLGLFESGQRRLGFRRCNDHRFCD